MPNPGAVGPSLQLGQIVMNFFKAHCGKRVDKVGFANYTLCEKLVFFFQMFVSVNDAKLFDEYMGNN